MSKKFRPARYSGGQTVSGAYGVYTGVMLVLMGVCIGLVSLFVCSIYVGENGLGWDMFLSYLHEPLLLALNIVPCVLLVLFFWFAAGRAWAAFTFPALIVFILSLIDYYKIRIRTEPFIASDLVLASEAAGIISRYTLEITGRVILTAAALVFGVLFTVFLMPRTLRNGAVRVIGAVLALAALVSLGMTVYASDRVYSRAKNHSIEYNEWSELHTFVSKGFVFPFLHSVKDAIPHAPQGYSEKAAKAVLAAYTPEDIPEDKKVNIIAVMLEAYTDLSEHPEVPVHADVYAPLHALYEECLHGHIISNVFAGGTVNTERNFLTGYPHAEDYRVRTNSYVWYLRSQGYHAEGWHPGDSWFYNRQNVQRNLGMEDFYFLEDYGIENRADDYYHRSDRFFFPTLTDLYDKRDRSVPYFNFSVTYQNHGAYNAELTYAEPQLEKGYMSDYAYYILNNYLSGIADTSQRISDFIDTFRDDPEPVVIVFFGDHMPWLGDANSVYTELGINIDLGTQEGFYNYYSTPYIIWANDAAKAATGGAFTGDGGAISSCYLMSRIFDECGWTGGAYMQLNREVRDTVSVYNTGSGIWCADGTLTLSPEGDAAALIERLDYAEYYLKHHFIYESAVE